MKILPERSIENDVYTTVLKPLEWGTATVTADSELAMLKDTPQTLRYADIEFKEKFKVVDGLPVVSAEGDAVEVTLDLNNKEFLLDENLNDQTFNSSYRPIIIHKEKYNDRFIFTEEEFRNAIGIETYDKWNEYYPDGIGARNYWHLTNHLVEEKSEFKNLL